MYGAFLYGEKYYAQTVPDFTFILSLLDTITVTDNVLLERIIFQSFQESISLSDNIVRDATKEFVDTIVVIDLSDIVGVGELIEFEVCVRGSAGATRPLITLKGELVNPVLTNLTNGCQVSYDGNILFGEYIKIDFESSNLGDVDSFDIETNIASFDPSDLIINNRGNFELNIGVNKFELTADPITPTSKVYIHFLNKYHN